MATAVALLAFALAVAIVVQDSGPNQAAHFALVRALADGTAEIDPRETIDASYVDGRFYAAKAPGLAMFTLPWHGLLRAVGLQDGAPASATAYRTDVWELTLAGSVLPLLALLLLVVVAVERVAPGLGVATAALLGAGTLLLPFATLLFDHVLAAALGFAAFVALVRERDRPGGWWLAAGGLLAGLAIVVELPLGITALVLAAYAAVGRRVVRRLATYVLGVVVGVLPLLAYNTWAFGSPWTLAYTNALERPVDGGPPVVGANDEGFYGVGIPDLRAALSLLVSEKGLLVVTPVVAAALVGLPLLWRGGRRAEAVVCAAVPALFFAYNAAYYLPFGGQGPGPRFLVAALPFLALPLALALRARPLVTVGLALVSAAVMTLATLTGPLTGVEYGIGTWLSRLADGDLVTTVPSRLGADEWLGAALVVAAVAAALGLAVSTMPRLGVVRDALDEVALLGVALLAWLVVVLVGPHVVPASEEHGTREGTLAGLLLLALVALAVVIARRRSLPALVLLTPVALLAPALESRPRAALLVIAAALAGGVALRRRFAASGSPLASRE